MIMYTHIVYTHMIHIPKLNFEQTDQFCFRERTKMLSVEFRYLKIVLIYSFLWKQLQLFICVFNLLQFITPMVFVIIIANKHTFLSYISGGNGLI